MPAYLLPSYLLVQTVKGEGYIFWGERMACTANALMGEIDKERTTWSTGDGRFRKNDFALEGRT